MQQNLLDEAAHDLLDWLNRRSGSSQPVVAVQGAPAVLPELREAAFVIGALLEPARLSRVANEEVLADHARRCEPWLRPVLERHGLGWRWVEAESARVREHQAA